MTTVDPYSSAESIADRVRKGTLSPVDVVETYLERIEEFNPDLNAFVTVATESAREAASEAERAIERGDDLGPLHGVPVAIKDLNRVRGIRTTYGSAAFADNVPNIDDTVVARLRESGAIIIGKTNTPEFGRKTVTDNPLFGASTNPWDRDRTTGGSSGGSAAAVAAGLVPLALGSDAAGSIRIPASACGIVGLHPDFGRVPDGPERPDAFENILPYTFIGPMTRTVGDAALMLEVIAGPDIGEPYSLPTPNDSYLNALDISFADLTIGYSPTFGGFRVESEVCDAVEAALNRLSAAGATVTDLDLSFVDSWTERHDALEWLLQQRYVGLYQNLKRTSNVDLLQTDHEITPEVTSRIRKGLELDASTMAEARHRQTVVYEEIQRHFDSVDIIATPTLSRTAFDRSTSEPTVDGETVHPMHGWTLTWPLNLSGNPAGSVPIGFDDKGLPIGMQLIGARLDDWTVVGACAAVERELPWAEIYPPTDIGGTT